MALKITLKPRERLVAGGAVISNDGRHSCALTVQNNVPVLREKDIMSEKEATTPCSKLYFTIQLMYIDHKNQDIHINEYWKIAKELIGAVPSLTGYIDQISEFIVNGLYYKALKLSGELIEREQEVLLDVRQSFASV
jgi:flagellar protein FlbT